MLEIILYAVAALAAIVVIILVIAALKPSDFRVVRSASMSAPPPAVFAQVNDFHNWESWSPWAKIDPTMKQTYAGAPAGTGAIYTWDGNNNVGAGRMTMTESRPHERIQIKLEFFRPFAAVNTAEFAFQAEGQQTTVTWSMAGTYAFMVKVMGFFMSMDKMVGGQFEKGLAQMKALVETPKQ
jgi:hypothetical protein